MASGRLAGLPRFFEYALTEFKGRTTVEKPSSSHAIFQSDKGSRPLQSVPARWCYLLLRTAGLGLVKSHRLLENHPMNIHIPSTRMENGDGRQHSQAPRQER
jgi:hypothetical protein